MFLRKVSVKNSFGKQLAEFFFGTHSGSVVRRIVRGITTVVLAVKKAVSR